MKRLILPSVFRRHGVRPAVLKNDRLFLKGLATEG
jgi:hypothetical protein